MMFKIFSKNKCQQEKRGGECTQTDNKEQTASEAPVNEQNTENQIKQSSVDPYKYFSIPYLDVYKPAIELGGYSFPNRPTLYYWGSDCRLVVGRYVSIAMGATIVLGGEHNLKGFSTSTEVAVDHLCRHTKGDIVIGSDVWIAANSLVLSGVKIGTGAIVGAGAVVTKDVPEYAIVVGNPMRILRYRFDRRTRERLLRSKWWEHDAAEIKACRLECSDHDDVDEFLTIFERRFGC